VADTGNNAVRKITTTGIVSTLAGVAGIPDPAGKASSTNQLNNPGGVTVDEAGNVYVADTNNHCVRKIGASN
jgi:hypothetical protein